MVMAPDLLGPRMAKGSIVFGKAFQSDKRERPGASPKSGILFLSFVMYVFSSFF